MRVAVIHPWFPQYREEFFRALVTGARSRGIDVDVFHGSPPPEWGERGDSVSTEYAVPLRTRFFKLGSKNLVLKNLAPLRPRSGYDLIVVEQAVRNIETYRMLFSRGGSKVAFWGHGKTYTEIAGRRQESLKRWLTSRGAWFFAYTQGGADAVIGSGFDRDKTTVVQNSIDTGALLAELDTVAPVDVSEFRARYSLTSKTALFIGGLDEAKRIPFLLAAAERAHERDDDFRLLIVGNGEQAPLVQAASKDNQWIVYLGSLFGRDKAVAMKSSSVLAMPGRVGLVAVDSFAAGTPIIATDWGLHAPEFEYLRPGKNAIVTPDSIDDYAEALVSLLNDPGSLAALRAECRVDAGVYTVEAMASNFIAGVESYRQRAER